MYISRPPAWLTMEQACRLAGRSESTLRVWIKRGRIIAHRFGKAWMISEPEILRACQKLPKVGRPRRNEIPSADVTRRKGFLAMALGATPGVPQRHC